MMRSAAGTPIGVLRSPATIRERSRNILEAAAAGRSKHFRIDQSRLDVAAARVEAVTRRRYGDLRIPYHSRWRHFEAGGVDRKADLDRALAGRDPTACARARVDLTVVSVLLDAGAGAAWGYVERETGVRYTRSEGLGVASFRAFLAGAFSARRDDPLRADAAALSRIDAPSLAKIFNVDPANPLVGFEGRAALLRRLETSRGSTGTPSHPRSSCHRATASRPHRSASLDGGSEARLLAGRRTVSAWLGALV